MAKRSMDNKTWKEILAEFIAKHWFKIIFTLAFLSIIIIFMFKVVIVFDDKNRNGKLEISKIIIKQTSPQDIKNQLDIKK